MPQRGASQVCGPYQASITGHFRQFDPRNGTATACGNTGFECCTNRVEERRSDGGNSSANHEKFGVQNRLQNRTRRAQLGPQVDERTQRALIPGFHQCHKTSGRDFSRIGDELRQTATVSFGTFVCVSLQGAARGVLFDASASAAGAFQSAGVNAHVAKFSGRAESASKNFSRSDNGPTQSGSDGEHCHVGDILPRTKPVFGPAGSVRVIVDENRKVDALREKLCDGDVDPASDIGRDTHRFTRQVDKSGDGDAHGYRLMVTRKFRNHLGNGINNVLTSRGVNALLRKDSTVGGHHTPGDLGSADIDSNCVHRESLRNFYSPALATSRVKGNPRPKGVSVKEFSTPILIPNVPTDNITDLLETRFSLTPDLVLFGIQQKDGTWAPITVSEFREHVMSLAKGFIAAGIKPGDKIGMMCKVSYEWTLVDFAMFYAGATLVPVYETSSPSQIAYTLNDSGATGLIVETAEYFQRFDEIRPETPLVESVWQLHLNDVDKLITAGVDVTDEELEARRTSAQSSDLATLIYTSGSTGNPKGCILSHGNFVDTIRNSALEMDEVVGMPGASTLLFITAAHVFARFISILCVHSGVRVGHQSDTKLLLPSLGSFQPTFLLAVPRVFEKVFNSSEQKAEAAGKGAIFRKAAATAIAYSRALDAGKVPLGLKLQFAVLDKLVLSKLRHALGGKVVYAISGSAPLGSRLGHFYRSLGFRVLEGYGLTETTAPATINLAHKFKIGTVGPVLPGISVRTEDDGEILVKGINVFQGYWKNAKATNEVLQDGWFRTGDIGSFDDDGYLTITGRKKEIIVTAGGKNVAPPVLEDPIRANLLVGQCVVVGDRRPFVGALITLDMEMLPVWLHNVGLDPNMSAEEASQHPQVLAEIQTAVDRANKRVSRAESIRKFVVLPTEFTEASGHLTPKMSIKRAVIVSDFSAEIDALYGDSVDSEGLGA